MEYSFEPKIATLYGVDGAVFMHSIYWWIRKNEANGRHFYDGTNWTYNSTEALLKLFPFWTKSQIERIIKKLRNDGALLVGNYNQTRWDRTRWFALSDKVKCIYENREMDIPETDNSISRNQEISFHDSGTPIPVSKPVNKPDIFIYPEIINYLNLKAHTDYRPSSKATRRLIDARLNEKFTLEDFKKVIDIKCAEWGRLPEPGEKGKDMRRYLRPETLFGTRFESYLNQKPPTPRQPITARTAGSSIDTDKLDAAIDRQFGGPW